MVVGSLQGVCVPDQYWPVGLRKLVAPQGRSGPPISVGTPGFPKPRVRAEEA